MPDLSKERIAEIAEQYCCKTQDSELDIMCAIDAALAEQRALDAQEQGDVAYICAECGGFGYAEIDSLDSGTTLICDSCKGKTVVLLNRTDDYCTIVQLQAELNRQKIKMNCGHEQRFLSHDSGKDKGHLTTVYCEMCEAIAKEREQILAIIHKYSDGVNDASELEREIRAR